MSTEATILVQSLGWALLHSLWQGLLIYCCLRIVLKLSGNITSQLKYHLSVAALGGSFVWFINTCIAQYQRLQGITIHITQSGADPAATKTYALTTLPTQTNSSMLNNVITGIEPFFPVLVGLYIAGIAFLLLRLIVNLAQVSTIRTKGVTAADHYWTEWIQQWEEKLDISRKVQLFFSERVNVPMTMGVLKPVILLPVASLNNLTQDQLEAILLHELAHIKRHDYLFNIIQTVVETILFFNPFTWLISQIIRKEREHCCDDVVMTNMNTPLPYAKALAELEIQRFNTNNKIALAATGNKNQLLNRIKRIMEMKKKPVNYTQFGVAAILILALIVLVAWFSPVMAQNKKTAAKDKKGNKTATSANNKKVTTVSKTIIIDSKDEDNRGVHPNDVGNAEDIRKRVEEAMAGIDMEGMGDNVKAALESINWEELGNNVNTAIARVDWDKMSNEASTTMANIDWDEINREIEKATREVKDVDWNEINRQIKEATADIDMAYSGKGSNAVVVKKGSTTIHTDKMTINGRDFSEVLDEMEEDGIINKAKGYNIELEDGQLYIDGKRQTGAKADKFIKYFKKGSNAVIEGDNNNTSININISN